MTSPNITTLERKVMYVYSKITPENFEKGDTALSRFVGDLRYNRPKKPIIPREEQDTFFNTNRRECSNTPNHKYTKFGLECKACKGMKYEYKSHTGSWHPKEELEITHLLSASWVLHYDVVAYLNPSNWILATKKENRSTASIEKAEGLAKDIESYYKSLVK